MRIAFDVQALCVGREEVRGIPYYEKNLLQHMIDRKKHDYGLCFFDYAKERNNRQRLLNNLDRHISDEMLCECNDVDYRKIIKATKTNDVKFWEEKSYADYFDSGFDGYHLLSHLHIPQNLEEKSLVTVHDIIPMTSMDTLEFDFMQYPGFTNGIKYLRDKNISVLSVSEYTKKLLVDVLNFDEHQIHVVWAGYDEKIFFPEQAPDVLDKYGIDEDYFYYLGAIQKRKDITTLVKAFNVVKQTKKKAKLVISGKESGINNEFFEELQASKYKADIVLTGYVSDREKRILMSMAKAFVFPSLAEGFGLPVLEAMACGCPVITTDSTSLPEVGGQAALYFPVRQVERLAEIMLAIWEDGALYRECQNKGLRQARKFSWETAAIQTESVYEKVFGL